MGEVFVRKPDEYSACLWEMGSCLGQFIYLTDAAVDLKDDLKKERYNPLIGQRNRDFMPVLTMLMADCARCFEQLPIKRNTLPLPETSLSSFYTVLSLCRQTGKGLQGKHVHL